ncbi:MAG: hypothetical protein KKG00_04830, partial [Bacteroidetes bacterium]|nr:hypothetical protein [Bacteroidota bacterium]
LFLILYGLGQIGEVEKFPFDGSRDDDTEDTVENAAKWAMKKFSYEANIETLKSYLSDKRPKFHNHLPNAADFLIYHYPEQKNKIESEFERLSLTLKKYL